MKKLALLLFLVTTLSSCGVQWQYTSLSTAGQVDSIYRSSNIQADTITSLSDLRWKLRNDFNFRYDFATYAMQQPYTWYWNNPRLEGIWRPYNRFDVYFHSHWFWSDWAWGYNYYGWNSFYNWNRPWYYGWNRPYNTWYNGPWHNTGYNVVWNSSRRNNIANVIGPRGSRTNSIISRDNNNIENTIVRRYNKPRNNNNNIDNIVNELRENYNVKPRVYNNPNNVPNNGRPIINNNNNNINPPRGSWRPSNNNINIKPSTPVRTYSPPPSSNISRGSSVSSGGSSRGGNSRGKN